LDVILSTDPVQLRCLGLWYWIWPNTPEVPGLLCWGRDMADRGQVSTCTCRAREDMKVNTRCYH
jgi:hypothetical protein